MTACCCIDDGDAPAVFRSQDVARARKAYRCCECQREIPKGAPYRNESGLWDDRWEVYRICRLCLAIRRDRFNCGYVYGRMWEDLRDCLWESCDCDDPCDCDDWLDPPTHPIEVTARKGRL